MAQGGNGVGEETDQRYSDAWEDRKRHVEAIVQSPARNKIVVAGPGTGKTFLFGEILKGKSKTLTLTFVNSLVEDLSLSLYGMSDVRTLHGFARSELRRLTKNSIDIFPKLPRVIQQDAQLLLDEDHEFGPMFYDRDDSNPALQFYQTRRTYYGPYFGYADVVFDLVKRYEADDKQIPIYDQIVIDEFQDFNQLEVSLIDALESKSPMLVAGDDDQALYDFKNASAEHIRSRHGPDCPDYEAFELPYCSRSTRVIVRAANDVVSGAVSCGLLCGRISKRYEYFESKEKDKESDANPHIAYTQLFASQIPWYIEKRIKAIAEQTRDGFSVLVISQTRKQSDKLAAAMRGKGFGNIKHVERSDDRELSLMDGLRLLLTYDKSNLGWRIVAGCLLKPEELRKIVEASAVEGAKPIQELIDAKVRSQVVEMVKLCKKLLKGNSVDPCKLEEILRLCGSTPQAVEEAFVRQLLGDGDGNRAGDPALRGIAITATTVQSSKGLSAEYVFITHCDNKYMVKDEANISD